MKKLLLLAMVVVASTSCIKKEYLDCDCDGDGLYMNDETVSSPPSSWTLDREGGFYYTVWETDLLTPFVFERGQVLAYVYDGDRQVVLPSVRHLEEMVNGQPVRYTQTIDYEFFPAVDGDPGQIKFFVTNSDFIYEGYVPDLKFRIIYIW